MKIQKFVLGPVQTNCYIVINEISKEVFIVDPAICPDLLVSDLRADGIQPKAVLLTHAHFDHMGGAEEFARAFDIPVYVQEADETMMTNPMTNLSAGMGGLPVSCQGAKVLRDKETLEIAGYHILALHTPGHTPGGCCYYVESEGVLFSGDTLFQCSVGRSDFPGGDGMQLVWSIQEKLMGLPDETKVYPGHMDETTIGYERANNPYI